MNIWLDGGYRMNFTDRSFYQLASVGPIGDPWTAGSNENYNFDNALGPIITPQGLKAIYDTYYEDQSAQPFSMIALRKPTASSTAPNYTWDNSTYTPIL